MLNGDYATDSAVKFALQSLSVEYIRTGIPFDREAAGWRARIGAGRSVLVGIDAAFGGSSSTYAYLGEIRDEWRSRSGDFLRSGLPAVPVRPPSGPLQATLRRLGRDAGILGARFSPEPGSNAVEVRVSFGQSGREPIPVRQGWIRTTRKSCSMRSSISRLASRSSNSGRDTWTWRGRLNIQSTVRDAASSA